MKSFVSIHESNFKEGIIDEFTKGNIFKPDTTFGNVKADVLALKGLSYKRVNFFSLILGSSWNDGPHVACCNDPPRSTIKPGSRLTEVK